MCKKYVCACVCVRCGSATIQKDGTTKYAKMEKKQLREKKWHDTYAVYSQLYS